MAIKCIFLRNPSNWQNNLIFGKFVNTTTFAENLGGGFEEQSLIITI
jgi:hypothetical protein